MTVARTHLRDSILWVLLMDLFCLVMGIFVGIAVRWTDASAEYLLSDLGGWLVFGLSIILANYLAGSYRIEHSFSRFNLVVTWFFSLVFAFVTLSMASYLWLEFLVGRGVLLLSVTSYGILSLLMKLLVYRSLFRSSLFVCRTVVVGSSVAAERVRDSVEHGHILPRHKVVSYIQVVETTSKVDPSAPDVNGMLVISCPLHDVESIVRSLDVRLIVLAVPDDKLIAALYPQLHRLRFEGIEVITELDVEQIYMSRTPLDLITQQFLTQMYSESTMAQSRRVKRFGDLVAAVLGLIVLSPVFLLIALALKLTEPRAGVIYSQSRTGQFGKPFTIYKFRTMRENAEAETGAVWASDNDPRITRLGRRLRMWRLDELPQLVNVLKGEMSLVGPRPERPEIVTELERQIPFYAEREHVPPGITGWAQIRYPYGSSIEDARRKLEYDIFYIKSLSLSFDLQILLSTIRIVVLGKERHM
jgi:exopolysaccharide biosynthesis polyprenyl glycosylphosphotransferase